MFNNLVCREQVMDNYKNKQVWYDENKTTASPEVGVLLFCNGKTGVAPSRNDTGFYLLR